MLSVKVTAVVLLLMILIPLQQQVKHWIDVVV
jgi:hypothetical protein